MTGRRGYPLPPPLPRGRMTQHLICIGYDSPNPDAFAVCRQSLRRLASRPVAIAGIHLEEMRRRRMYWRPTSRRMVDGHNVLWDDISEAPMSTEFACSRFLAPYLAGWHGWAVFMDCDILALGDICRLLDSLDPRYALMCVQHNHRPANETKMDGRPQLGEIDSRAPGRYMRKNWSSVMAFNCSHPANAPLTLDMINTLPGRDLHRFCWLADHHIGALDPEWNFLVGHSDPQISPSLVHYTDGGPWLSGFEGVAFADEWRREFARWVNGDA